MKPSYQVIVMVVKSSFVPRSNEEVVWHKVNTMYVQDVIFHQIEQCFIVSTSVVYHARPATSRVSIREVGSNHGHTSLLQVLWDVRGVIVEFTKCDISICVHLSKEK